MRSSETTTTALDERRPASDTGPGGADGTPGAADTRAPGGALVCAAYGPLPELASAACGPLPVLASVGETGALARSGFPVGSVMVRPEEIGRCGAARVPVMRSVCGGGVIGPPLDGSPSSVICSVDGGFSSIVGSLIGAPAILSV
ncbi:MAG: hypothetical protein QOI41_7622 [Myxococcales bacterium]|nr:hypothetical protein [Myxococcales bacterium]